MILPDANLLLYACDAGSPFHPKAAAWWERLMNGRAPVILVSHVVELWGVGVVAVWFRLKVRDRVADADAAGLPSPQVTRPGVTGP